MCIIKISLTLFLPELSLVPAALCVGPSATADSLSCIVHEQKQDCGYLGIQQQECEARACCWQADQPGPWCYTPQQDGPTYIVTDQQQQGASTTLTLKLVAPVEPQYGPDFNTLTVLLEPQTPQRLHVKINPTAASTAGEDLPHPGDRMQGPRWEVPEWLLPRPQGKPFDPTEGLYSVTLPQNGQPFGIQVQQHNVAPAASSQAQQQAVFDTAGTRLVFKEQYMEISTSLAASTELYGLGETINPSGSLALPRDGRIITLWNYDVAAFNADVNLYGSHPFVLQLYQDGSAAGIFLLNSNGMDVELQQTSMTYRCAGFVHPVGPSPESVIQQYHDVVGRPAMPPYWALGFHQCRSVSLDFVSAPASGPAEAAAKRWAVLDSLAKSTPNNVTPLLKGLDRWGYKTLDDVEGVVAAYSAADIPLEVIWTDIDYMYKYRDFTTDPDRFDAARFKAFVDKLHAAGQRWVPITDCGIPVAADDPAYTSGLAAGVFIRDTTGQPYLGQVWPGPTHYPDFLSVNRTWPWWRDQLKRLWDTVPFDGMWIDMNEASNFCEGEVCSLPPHTTHSQHTPGQHTPSQHPSSQHTPSQHTPSQHTPSQHTPSQHTPSQHTPSQHTPSQHTPSQHTPSQHMSNQHTPSQHMPSQHSNSNSSSSSSTSSQRLGVQALAANCDLQCTEPSPDSKLAYPPYAIHNLVANKAPLGSKTLAMSARHVDGQLQYDTHNLYGLSEAAATHWALQEITGKRPFILTRSTFPGSGRHAAHWTGDNAATWQDLLWSVQGLLNSNMWGLAMAGADICGFQGHSTEELCARWIAAGAMYTFTRNHNTLGAAPQELYRWPAVAAAARKALALRYRLLPYLYTCMYMAHTEGGTVARPLFFEFPADKESRATSSQWMLGSSLLVAPVLKQGSDTVNAYLPAATWYTLNDTAGDGQRYIGPSTHKFSVPLTSAPPVFVRGGSIVPLQVSHNTTTAVRLSAITLLVALEGRQQPGVQGSRVQGDRGRMANGQGGGKLGVSCRQLQAAMLACVQPSVDTAAAAAGTAASGLHDMAGSASSASQESRQAPQGHSGSIFRPDGLLLGCGRMYWDSGDSLLVPNAAAGSITVVYSSVAQQDTRRGWVMVAVEGVDWAAAASAAGVCIGAGFVAAEVVNGGNAATATVAGPSAAGFVAGAAGKTKTSSSQQQQGSGEGDTREEALVIGDVMVYGVAAPPDGQVYGWWLDGRKLPESQVVYEADREVLRVRGLQLPLSGALLEWRVRQQVTRPAAVVVTE